jgi:hypothetical protein
MASTATGLTTMVAPTVALSHLVISDVFDKAGQQAATVRVHIEQHEARL